MNDGIELVLVFVLIGAFSLVATGVVLLILQRDREQRRQFRVKQAVFFGRRPTANAQPEALRCERCGRVLGPALRACPDQESGACPYHVVRTPGLGSSGRNWGCLILGAGLAGGGLAFLVRWFPASLCVAALGLISAAIGAFGFLASGWTVSHRTTGQTWQRHSLLGLPLTEFTATAPQTVALSVSLRRPLRYPASISTLVQGHDAYTIFYTALLSLVSQEALTLQITRSSKTALGFPIGAGYDFILAPGTRPPTAATAGELETRIVDAVAAWSGRTERYICFTHQNYRHRIFVPFLTLYDAVFVVFEGQEANPAGWLVLNLVRKDAVRRGWGRVEGRMRARFEPSMEYEGPLRADYAVILALHEDLKAAQPELPPQLAQAIEQAINALESWPD